MSRPAPPTRRRWPSTPTSTTSRRHSRRSTRWSRGSEAERRNCFATEWKDDPQGGVWLCEHVRLFANCKQPTQDGGSLGTPNYLVVVGRPNDFTPPQPGTGLYYPEV